MASSSNSLCAACKFLPRKCIQESVFANQPTKFSNIHKVFTTSNVDKILNELNPTQREDAVNSPAYEADARLRDLVYGCVGLISILQQRLRQLVMCSLNNVNEIPASNDPKLLKETIGGEWGLNGCIVSYCYSMDVIAHRQK
ncbi:protein ASYMMETRIC LEAVES 2-like [Macadamia integrifolia]|uniref:protein ASYMMETRIC LEAVES 2-like n=1 Tax=Macadamia integrifolia TaxID=60698 RepID=UPI001C4FBCD3|nr:protein ASYMMETRIC LEAVES 2-like [Macadamia integrifolia]